VCPVSAPPIPDGAIIIDNGRILEVGRFRDLSSSATHAEDLGEVLMLPGLINAHCHLDYTDMAGMIPPPKDFTDWINAIIGIKADWSYSDYARSWVRGAVQLLHHGITTVGDIEAVPELLPEVWNTTPLRIHSFIELLSVRGRRSPEQLIREALDCLEPARDHPGRLEGGLSPHALYSTGPELLHQAAATSLRLSIHIAESAAEDAMFRQADGPMYRWLADNGRNMDDCGRGSPVSRLSRLGLLSDRLLAIHCNHLDDDDVRSLADHGVHVVHCPRSHDYFGQAPFRLGSIRKAGINLSLATDSLASVRSGGHPRPELSLFEELRAAMNDHSGLDPATALEMVTCNPARALGRGGELGQLSPGARADLVTVAGRTVEHVVEAIAPKAVMIGGRWEKR
jgi:cytosine/adenosine deaminase-related metal-dependent hydrolase